MTTTTMGDLFAKAEKDGFSGKDMPHGEFDVRVKSATVKIAKKSGQERLVVTLEALSGEGACQDGSNFNPEAESHYFWFKFLSNFIDTKAFFTANPTANVTQIGAAIQQLAEGGQLNMRIRLSAQVDNPQYSEVTYLGPATGAADVFGSAAPAAAVPAAAPVAVPTAAAPAPPAAQPAAAAPAAAAPPAAEPVVAPAAVAEAAPPAAPAPPPAAPPAAAPVATEAAPWDE